MMARAGEASRPRQLVLAIVVIAPLVIAAAFVQMSSGSRRSAVMTHGSDATSKTERAPAATVTAGEPRDAVSESSSGPPGALAPTSDGGASNAASTPATPSAESGPGFAEPSRPPAGLGPSAASPPSPSPLSAPLVAPGTPNFMRLRTLKPTFTVGQPVDVMATVLGIGDHFSLSFGDGTPDVGWDASTWYCNGFALEWTATHRWDRPGHYVITAHPHGTNECSGDPASPVDPASYVDSTLTITLDIEEPRDTGSNGPQLPMFDDLIGIQPGAVGVFAIDPDGQMRNSLIDWGDGTPLEDHRMDQALCADPAYWTPVNTSTGGRHEYDPRFAPEATVTITVYSVGCDQQSEQSSTMTVQIPTR